MRLTIQNPSDHPRQGLVVTPWPPLQNASGIAPHELVVRDADGNLLDAQVEIRDAQNRTRDVLVIRLKQSVPPSANGNPGWVELSSRPAPASAEPTESAEPDGPAPPAAPDDSTQPADADGSDDSEDSDDWDVSDDSDDSDDSGESSDHPAEPDGRTAFSLANDCIQIWMSLAPAEGRPPWYTGAATSVTINVQKNPFVRGPYLFTLQEWVDILDAYLGVMTPDDHDPEKRCMQIDRLCLSLPAWEPAPCQYVDVLGLTFRVDSVSTGPVRTSVAIASDPFPYVFHDPSDGKERRLSLELHRVFSLQHGADHVFEEISLRPAAEQDASVTPGLARLPVHFVARYFACMDMGLEPQVTHFAAIPDWFSVSVIGRPHQGYGFATDAHVSRVHTPHPGYPIEEKEHKTFSWELGIAHSARCVHLFRFCPPDELVNETGRAWYYHLYHPLWATT